MLRAVRNDFNCYMQMKARLNGLKTQGHDITKIDVRTATTIAHKGRERRIPRRERGKVGRMMFVHVVCVHAITIMMVILIFLLVAV